MTPGGTPEAPLSRSERLLQIVLSLAFAAAGLIKIVDPLSFALSIARLRTAPSAMIGPVAIVLPWIELVAALALFFPKYRGPALRIALALLVAFTAIVGIALIRATAASCGCFVRGDGFLSR